MINAGAWTTYSSACMMPSPFSPVRSSRSISNVHKRDEWRHHSVISPIVTGQIVGLGQQVYTLALRACVELIKNRK